MKKILFYILIFTTITGGLFGFFGDSNDKEIKNSILGVEKVYAYDCPNGGPQGVLGPDNCPSGGGGDGSFSSVHSGDTGVSRRGVVSKKSDLGGYNVPACFSLIDFSIAGCFTSFSYYIAYIPSSFVLEGSAKIMNKMLSFSMSKEIIDQPFVKTTWSATRNFANMLFILVLVIISISIILDIGKFSSKTLIVNVVIIALLINFSLFVSRVVIDTGNIVALGFYDSIQTPLSQGDIDQEINDVQEKDIAGAIVQSFNPTNIFSPTSFELWRKTRGENNTDSSYLMLAIIFLVAAGINYYTAYLFFMAGFIFVVRIAWLWILMATAPLAFISFAIPTFKEYWGKWWNELFRKSFCIVVFMFLIWLTLMIIGGDFLKGAFGVVAGDGSSAKSIIDFLVIVFLQYMVVITLLRMSLSKTKTMCDDENIGNKIFGAGKAMLGLAGFATGGALVGAAGITARKTIGGMVGSRVSNIIEERQKQGKSTGGFSRLILRGAKGFENSKFGMKESYKQQTERVVKEEKDLVKKFKDITLKDGTVKKKEDLEKEYYEKQQKVGKTIRRTAKLASLIPPLTPLAAPLAVVMEMRKGGENKAFLDYKEKRSISKEVGRLKEELNNTKQELTRTKSKANLLRNNPGAQNPVNLKKEKLEEQIKQKNEEIKKKEELIKKLVG